MDGSWLLKVDLVILYREYIGREKCRIVLYLGVVWDLGDSSGGDLENLYILF